MHRHRRNHYGTVEPNTYTEQTIGLDSASDLYYGALISSVPSEVTNGVLDSGSVTFTSGYISLNTIDLDYIWTFQTWIKSSQTTIPLLSIDGLLELTYNTTSSKFVLVRRLYSGNFETFNLPAVVDFSTWKHLAVVRHYNTVTIYVNLEETVSIDNFYYPTATGDGYFGKVGSNTLTGQAYNILLTKKRLYPSNQTILTNLEATKNPYYTLNSSNDASDFKILQLVDKELVSNSIILPAQSLYSYYDAVNERWSIEPSTAFANPRTSLYGLSLFPDVNTKIPTSYTLEFSFNIDTNNDVVLCSYWNVDYPCFYFHYNQADNTLNFTYFNATDIENQKIILGEYSSEHINVLALTVSSLNFNLFLNGKKVYTNTDKLLKLASLGFKFNWDVDGIVNTNSKLYLYSFTLTSITKYTRDYIPFTNNSDTPFLLADTFPYNYPSIETYYKDKPAFTVDFSVSGSTTLTRDSSTVYTINQLQRVSFPVSYSITYLPEELDELQVGDITFSSTLVTIAANQTSNTFTLNVANYAVNPYKKKFKLIITNKYVKSNISITISSPSLTLSSITSISGYVDGYLTADSITPGVIPNIGNIRNASTAASRQTTDFYGITYRLTSPTDSINLPASLTNIKSVVLLYRELVNTENRTYVGDSSSYTFNGGEDGSIIGTPILNSGDFITALNLSRRAPQVAIAANDSMFVLVDDLLQKVFVYERANTGIWGTTPTELNLELSDLNVLQGISISVLSDGTAFALGFKNGNNGEGVAQVWRKVSGIWTKELHLGSPIPNPSAGAFGYSVQLALNGTILIVSEIGSSSVYVFRKNTLWSATPLHTFTGTNRFGYSVSCNTNATLLAITNPDTNATSIYSTSNQVSWTEEVVINFGQICVIHPSTNKILISSISTGIVRLYSKTSTWTLTNTFTNEEDFGYSIGFSANDNIAISSPLSSKVRLYKAADSYTSPILFTVSSFNLSLNDTTILTTDYSTNVLLYTTNPGAVPQTITRVRQVLSDSILTDNLATDDMQILIFQSSVPMTISSIGSGKIGTGLNGLVAGAMFFTSTLSNTDIDVLETTLSRYLRLNKYGLYA